MTTIETTAPEGAFLGGDTASAAPAATDARYRREREFILRIQRRCEWPGPRAELRRGLRRKPELALTATRHIMAGPHPDLTSAQGEKVTYAIASYVAAFAHSPRAGDCRTMGRALTALQGRGVSRKSIESRLMTYARATTDAMLYQHLPSILTQMKSKGIQVDMARLMVDLTRWETGRTRVVKSWMQDYYTHVNHPSEAKEEDEGTDSRAK